MGVWFGPTLFDYPGRWLAAAASIYFGMGSLLPRMGAASEEEARQFEVTQPTCSRVFEAVKEASSESRELSLAAAAIHAPAGDDPGEACDDYPRVKAALTTKLNDKDVEIATMERHRVALFRRGPEGSGRYWENTIAIDLGGGEIVGGCITTATTGFRTVSRLGFLEWTPFDATDPINARLVLWDSVLSGDETLGSVLFAQAWRLQGKKLVFDHQASRRENRRLATKYAQLGGRRGNPFSRLHAAAAKALSAFAAGKTCRDSFDPTTAKPGG